KAWIVVTITDFLSLIFFSTSVVSFGNNGTITCSGSSLIGFAILIQKFSCTSFNIWNFSAVLGVMIKKFKSGKAILLSAEKTPVLPVPVGILTKKDLPSNTSI